MRHGSEDGLVTLGGRQVSIRRPRVRSADRTGEVPLPTYRAVASTELLGRETLERMMAKLSTRRYGAGLEPVGPPSRRPAVDVQVGGVPALRGRHRDGAGRADGADLSELDLVAIMIDGVHFAGSLLRGGPRHRHRGQQAAARRRGG